MKYKAKTKEQDRLCARKSNIPECCIDFWLNEWITGLWNHELMYFRYSWGRDIPDWVQYVPCPQCIRDGKYNQIYECTHKDFEVCEFGCVQSQRVQRCKNGKESTKTLGSM